MGVKAAVLSLFSKGAQKRSQANLGYRAVTAGYRSQNLRPTSSGPISEISRSRIKLQQIARDMVRNNGMAKRLPQVIGQNVIGAGILPNAVCERGAEKDRIEGFLKDHLDTPLCHTGLGLDLYGIQGLATEIMAVDGEVLIIRHDRTARRGDALNFTMEVREVDYLDARHDQIGNGGHRCVNGIVFDPSGRRLGYWLFDDHPGDLTYGYGLVSRFYPAHKVIHLFRDERPGQVNGVPWLAPVVLKAHDLHDFGDARLYREKIAGAFTAFITRNSEAGMGLPSKENSGDPANYPLEQIQPGVIEHLAQGDEISFGSPPQTDGFKEFWGVSALELSMGVGLSYATYTGDMSGGSFTSNRMGWLEDQRYFSAIRSRAIQPKMLWPITQWVQLSADLVHGVKFKINWVAPARDQIDPAKDAKADIALYDAGIKSRTQIISERGRDIADVDLERSQEGSMEPTQTQGQSL